MTESTESSNPDQPTPSPQQAGADRLLRALTTAPPDRRTCSRIRAAFPAMAEAELRGARLARLFPVEVAHLDGCEVCAQEYGELLDALLELEAAAGAPPITPAPVLAPSMLAALRIRRWVTATAQQILHKTLQHYGDVELQLTTWLEQLAATPGNIGAQTPQLALAYGGEDAELPLILATWFVAQTLAEQHTVDELRALARAGKLAVESRRVAERVAQQLPKAQRRTFVDAFVAQTLADPDAVIELGRPQ